MASSSRPAPRARPSSWRCTTSGTASCRPEPSFFDARPLKLLLVSALAALLLAAAEPGRAASLRYCSGPDALSPKDKDRLLRFGALVRQELEGSGQDVALIARSGLDLSRFGVRYSHAGVSLKASDNTPWSVRQLYYACDESQARLFDQGIAGFVLGTDEPALGYVSLVFMPVDQAQSLARSALDKAQALRMLNSRYSANAYPFSLRYQNCNQWVVELLAVAWGGIAAGEDARGEAQAWLRSSGYVPAVFDVGRPLFWLSPFVPWVHDDDHPAEDRAQAIYRVSMPAAIEAFVRSRVPEATRVELCHTATRAVIHRGWEPIAAGCEPAPGDTVITLD